MSRSPPPGAWLARTYFTARRMLRRQCVGWRTRSDALASLNRRHARMDATPERESNTREIDSFVRRAIGLRFEMRFKDEARWWPINAWEVGETLLGYYYDYGVHSCLEMMREGKELPTALAVFRIRPQIGQPPERADSMSGDARRD